MEISRSLNQKRLFFVNLFSIIYFKGIYDHSLKEERIQVWS